MLSIIIPVYNGENYIEETLNYVLKSDFYDLEVIVVNDGSTDLSIDIIKSVSEKDARIILYNKENGGVVSARNFGAEKATGEYLCFMDQDDIVDPHMYSKMINQLEKDQSDMAMCSSARSIDGKISILDLQKDGIYRDTEIKKELLYPILFNGYAVPMHIGDGNHYNHIWTCIFRKSFWVDNHIHFRAYINFEDDMLVKVETLAKAKCVSTISYIGYLWRVNLNSETYAHHFVKDIGKKQELCFRDIEQNLMESGVEQEILRYVKQILYCKQYIDAIHYLSSPEIKINYSFIKKYYNQNIYARDFNNAIQGRKFLKRGWIKPRILLPLLASKHTYISFWAEIILDKLLVLSLHSQLLTKFERKIKNR